MIRAVVEREKGAIRALTVHGHAGYAEAGRDLVCAAVSAMVQTALLGLAELAPKAQTQVEEATATIRVTASPDAGEAAQVILRTLELGLEDLAGGMPEYVELKRRCKP